MLLKQFKAQGRFRSMEYKLLAKEHDRARLWQRDVLALAKRGVSAFGGRINLLGEDFEIREGERVTFDVTLESFFADFEGRRGGGASRREFYERAGALIELKPKEPELAAALRRGRKIRLNVEGDLRALAYLQSQMAKWRTECAEARAAAEGEANRPHLHKVLEKALPVCLYAEEMQELVNDLVAVELVLEQAREYDERKKT